MKDPTTFPTALKSFRPPAVVRLLTGSGSVSYAYLFPDPENVFPILADIADLVHHLPDQEDPQASDLPFFRGERDVRIRLLKRIKRYAFIREGQQDAPVRIDIIKPYRYVTRFRRIGITGDIGNDLVNGCTDLDLLFGRTVPFFQFPVDEFRNQFYVFPSLLLL